MKRAVVLLLALVLACAPAKAPRTVSLRLVGAPSEATVTIDDSFVGRLEMVAARGVALPVGTHRVSIEAAGYLPWDRLVEAKEGQPVRLEAKLVPIPD